MNANQSYNNTNKITRKIKDFPEMLSRLAPKDIEYAHNNTWHDGIVDQK